MNPKIQLSPQLIRLFRDQQMLLMDGARIQPLLINEGADIIQNYLKDCAQRGNRDDILEKYPDPDLLQAMLDHGILQEQRNGEPHGSCCQNQICQVCKIDKNQKRPGLSLYLLLTQYCNLGCIYCLNGDETYQKQCLPEMEEKVAFQAVDRSLDSLTDDGNLEIVFFGGEPLLNWPLAKKVILFCESQMREKYPRKTWKYHLTTNLTVFPDDLIEWSKRYNVSYLVDVDGPPELHNYTRPSLDGSFDSYAKTAEHIQRLVDVGIQPALRSTVTTNNVEAMLEITQLHRDLGGEASAFVELNPVNSDEIVLSEKMYPTPKAFGENLRKVMESGIWPIDKIFPANEFLQRLKPFHQMRIACGAPYGNTPTVDVNGDVYACIYLVGLQKFFIGNVFDSRYPDENVLNEIMRRIDVHNLEQCSTCAYRYLCAGGCPVGHLTVEGNPKATPESLQYVKTMTCVKSKTVVQHLLWEIAEGVKNLESIQESVVSVC